MLIYRISGLSESFFTILTASIWYPNDTHSEAGGERVITHDKRLKDVDKELEQFFEAIGPLSDNYLP
jgi:hypothetical protein